MYKFICTIGQKVIDFITNCGFAFLMLVQALVAKPNPKHFSYFIKQLYVLAVRSLPIIFISGLFIGAVLAIQGYSILVRFKGESFIGTMVVIAVLRELAPVVTGLLYAGRAGSSLTAEIALMKSTEQLSSLEMMAVDPLRRVVAPRFWASFFSLPMLTVVFMAVGIYAAALISVDWKQVDAGDYWGSIQAFISVNDFHHGIVKSVIFAFFIAWFAWGA